MTAAADSQSDAARLFTPIAVLGMVCVGVFAFLAFVTLSAYAPDLRGRMDGGPHALSRSAIGYAGLVELLKAQDTPVFISRGARPNASAYGLLILTPDAGVDPKEIKAFGFPGPMLLVLPKWMATRHPTRPGWVRRLGLLDPSLSLSPVEAWGGGLKLEQRPGLFAARLHRADGDPDAPAANIVLDKVESLRSLSGDGWVPILADQDGRALVVRAKQRALYVLADPDLLNNHGIKTLKAAQGAVALIDALPVGDPVIFDVTLNGFKRARSVLKLALEPPFLAATLCLLAAAFLMGLHALSRFGPTARTGRALALGKAALVDNSAGLIRMTRREPRMAGGYWLLTREAVARSVGAPPGTEGAELDALLDRLGEGQASRLAAEAKAVKDTPALMRAARNLHRWRMEMTREHR